jgi:hypothetical protein
MARRVHLHGLQVALVLLLLSVAAAELALRAAGFEYPPACEREVVLNRDEDRAMRDGTGLNQFDPDTLWSPRPGACVPWTEDERVNAAGYRGPLVEKERMPGVMRILTLGSCAAFGRGVPYEDTYSALLERRLRERGIQAEVLAGGVVGSTIQQGLERYRTMFRAYRPDLVISSFCGYSEHESAPRFECDSARIKAWCAASDKSPCRARSWSARRNLRTVQLPIWMIAVLDGSYWNEMSIDFEDRRLQPQVLDCAAPVIRRVSPSEFIEALETLEKEVRADGGHLITASVPNNLSQARQSSVVQVYCDKLRDFCEREHLIHVNGRLVIQLAAMEGMPMSDLFDADGFLSGCAHDLLADALADEIVAHREDFVR